MAVINSEEITRISKRMRKEQRALLLRRLRSSYGLLIGGGLLLLIVGLALIGPLITPYAPNGMKVIDRFMAPSAAHLFGTDEFGRDLLTRIIYGAQVSMGVGLAVAAISSVLGLIIGIYSAYYKALDHILMRICDGLIAIPGILLAIALMAALGASVWNVIIALTIVFTPGIARVVRSTALVVREQTYIEAMHAQGASDTRIIWGHIVPNTLSPMLVQATFVFAEAIISEAALSFLGAGVPVDVPSWGSILYSGKLVIYKAWWVAAFPGILIILSVLSLNLLGDGLRDLLDPRVKQLVKKR